MKTFFDMQADALFEQWCSFMILHRDLVHENDMCFDRTKGLPAAVLIDCDYWVINQTNDPEKKYFIYCNHLQPVMTEEDIAAHFDNIKARASFETTLLDGEEVAVLKIEDIGIEPTHHIGKYINSLQEAFDFAESCKTKPVAEWDKEYNPPVIAPS